MLYAVGGVDGVRLNTSEYTALQADGTLAAWRAGSAMNEARGFFGVAAHNDFIYAVGGGNGPNGSTLLRSVERAAILAGGTLGPWQREPQPLRLPRRCAKVAVIGDYLYALGGYSGALLDSVERARIHKDGSLGAWELLDQALTIPVTSTARRKPPTTFISPAATLSRAAAVKPRWNGARSGKTMAMPNGETHRPCNTAVTV